MESMKAKFSQRKSALILYQFLISEKPALREHGAEKFCRVLSASVPVDRYVLKDFWVRELFSHVFCKRIFPVTVLSGTRFLLRLLDNSQAKAKMVYKVNKITAFEAQLHFHAMVLRGREDKRKS